MTRQEILDKTVKAVNETPQEQRTVENIVQYVLMLVGKEDEAMPSKEVMVAQFHRVFNQYSSDKPEIPALEIVNLRRSLIEEEAQ